VKKGAQKAHITIRQHFVLGLQGRKKKKVLAKTEEENTQFARLWINQ